MDEISCRSGRIYGGKLPLASEGLALSGLAFDDEPIESVLYAAPGRGPSPAGAFDAVGPALAAIGQAAESGDMAQALRLAAALLHEGTAVPARVLESFVDLLRPIIPDLPRPIVTEHGIAYEDILEPVLHIALEGAHSALMGHAGVLLYRWYESVGRFGCARAVIAKLLARARQEGSVLDAGVLTNNLGYEYQLDSDWARAESCFVEACGYFRACASGINLANACANRLLCDYELDAGEPGVRFEHEARRLLAALHGDWRRRKPLVLLARVEERRGNLGEAVALAQLAVAASAGMPTQLRLEDQALLDALIAKPGARRPSGSRG